jgi:[pyruvate, water dikinase]-phosphate phosphotransferase / [pyruvate, water dikinase] kinase
MLASTGENTNNLARACLVQFENLEVKTLEHYQIQIKTRADCVLAATKECPGAVIYTALNEKLSAVLEQGGSRLSILCINVLGRIILKLKSFLGRKLEE